MNLTGVMFLLRVLSYLKIGLQDTEEVYIVWIYMLEAWEWSSLSMYVQAVQTSGLVVLVELDVLIEPDWWE